MKKYRALLLRFLPILLVLALTAGFSNMFFHNLVTSTEENCWEELFAARDEAATAISTRLNSNLKILNLAADAIIPNADFRDTDAVCRYLADVKTETLFDRIDVVFPDGSILVQSTGERVADNGEKTYTQLLAKGAHISPRVPDFLSGQQAMHIFSPVQGVHGESLAILGATIYCSTLAELFTDKHYGDGAQFFIVDMRDGNIVLDKLHEEPGSIYDMLEYTLGDEYSSQDLVTDILTGSSDKLSYFSQLYQKTSYMVYGPVSGTDFTLIMVAQEDGIFAEANKLQHTLILAGAVEMLLLLFFAAWIYYTMRKSMVNERRAQSAELALLQQKEQELEKQYAAAANRQEFLELMAINLPGGYHRCTTDHTFRLTFISNSFTQVTGYTMEQLLSELGGSYMGIVAPEDKEYFLSLAPQLEQDGYINCGYRILRRDGSIRWVKDTTQYVERYGEQFYQCALMDITEQIEEIESAKQAAEASSHAKSTFLFNISHDIRTPMNAIKGFSHIIEENADDPAAVRDAIGKINQASDSLMMLMNDVLDISRIERGKEELNLQPIDLQAHGINLYEMFAAEMEAAGINFVVEGEMLTDYIYCDHLKLTRIMMNMLSNAKKFTPAGGTVVFGGIRLYSDEKSCTYRFFVRDTGIGMSREFLDRAFEQFERERTSTESGVSGSGLGLAIIKMMVDLMDGTVDIQSEPGKGTEISVTLTFELADREQLRDEKANGLVAPDMSGKRLLLVEDNEFNREIARYILEGMQFVVDEAENGAVCIEKLIASPPDFYDLILMDIQMPIMDGYAATIEIRGMADKKIAAIPIVAMTANAFEEDRRKCREVGMNDHIGKPIEVDALMKTLNTILR